MEVRDEVDGEKVKEEEEEGFMFTDLLVAKSMAGEGAS